MSVKTTNPKHQPKSPEEAFGEQLKLALADYRRVELSRRIKAGIALRKATQNGRKRSTSNTR